MTIKNTSSKQLLVSCLSQSSGIHFYISKNKTRDILEYIIKPIYKYHFTRRNSTHSIISATVSFQSF